MSIWMVYLLTLDNESRHPPYVHPSAYPLERTNMAQDTGDLSNETASLSTSIVPNTAILRRHFRRSSVGSEARLDGENVLRTYLLLFRTSFAHFLLFFFFPFPPPPAVCAAAGVAVTTLASVSTTGSKSILSPSFAMIAGAAVGRSINSPFANLPNPASSLPTSAALSVRYFKQIPDSGWKVFNVNVAEGSRLGGCCCEVAVGCANSLADVSKGFDFDVDWDLDFLGSEYLVVILVDG